MKSLWLIITSALLFSQVADANRTSKKLHKILDEVIQAQQSLSPQLATYLGETDRAGELDHRGVARGRAQDPAAPPARRHR